MSEGKTVHILQSASPANDLKEFVRAYAQRDVASPGPELVQPIPASLEHILEFEFAAPPEIQYGDGTIQIGYRIAVVGCHTRPGINLHLSGNIQSFGIFFQPLGLWQLFRVPAGELTDNSFSGGDLLGNAVEELWYQMADCKTFEARVGTIDQYLLKRAARASGRTTIMRAASHLFECRGMSRIDDLALHSGLSIRHFERRFLSDIGMTPKLFARITRFQMALDTKLHFPSRTWLTIAHDFGYHDQMHMIRDFEGLGGASPEHVLADLGDTRPPALAASRR
jgi:AraC-like DNA-binding protein